MSDGDQDRGPRRAGFGALWAGGRTAGGMRRKRGRMRRWLRVWRLLAALLVLSGMVGVLGSAVALPLATSTASAVNAGTSLYDGLPTTIPTVNLPQTAVILDAKGHPIAHLYDQNRTEVPLSQMSPHVQHAIVAIEDSRFFQHGAIDPRGLARAAVNDLAGNAIQGASTLTEQYVKNLLVDQALANGNSQGASDATSRTISRKLREMKIAISVEQHYTKDQILERYLNIVYFGEGTYGIQAAAERFFGVSAAKLDIAQAATLAGIVQDPAAYDPILHPKTATERRDEVLKDMLDQRMITQAQYTKAVKTTMKATGKPVANGCSSAGATGFFCDYVVQSLLQNPAYSVLGKTPAQRLYTLDTAGLVIRTTLDPSAQSAAVHGVAKYVPIKDKSGLGAAAVTVQPGTGAVVAMAENRTYSASAGPGRTSVNYNTDRALGGASGFQTGSSFKAFTLATWLAGGKSLYDSVNATKRGFPFSAFTSCGQPLTGTKPYVPGNAEGNETGYMSVLNATVNSVNVAYVDMETKMDLCNIASTAESLGVHLAAPAQVCSASAPATTKLPTCLPSLTLGVEDIAPLTMATAYAGFAAGGQYCTPMPVSKITSRAATDGSSPAIDATYTPNCTQAISPTVASGVSKALEQVLTRGTAAGTGPLNPWPSAGKTGTTDGPYDSWFVGYTAQRSTAVWVGDPGHSSHGRAVRTKLTNITVGGQYYPVIYGASIAAPIWKYVMTGAMQGLPARPLP